MADSSNIISLLGKIPVITTAFSVYFFLVLWKHYRSKPDSLYILWWTIGVFCYGIGTLTESYVGLLGWNPVVFKAWYISGALLGGFPLAQGTAYLLLSRRRADFITLVMVFIIITTSVFVIFSPLDISLVEPKRLTGKVLIWTQIRMVTPLVNIYSLLMLVGGALYSSWLYFQKGANYRNRSVGNVLIAVGGLLPGIGGSFTKFGFTEVLYVTELIGILLIYFGYQMIRKDTTQSIYINQYGNAGVTVHPSV